MLANNNIIPVILCGGAGKRLYPLSTAECPKQFLRLISTNSLLQDTILRLSSIEDIKPPLIVSNKKYEKLIKEHSQEINVDPSAIILEPVGRNTAPAIVIAAMLAQKIQDEDPILLILPSDHAMRNQQEFHKAIKLAEDQVSANKLVTFGIRPTKPETGYGYIKVSKTSIVENVFAIDKFVEKPNKEIAKEYLEAGNYFWNSGMFMFRASTILAEFNIYAADILAACKEAFSKTKIEHNIAKIPEQEFSMCPSNSIDYAIMEHTKKGVMVVLDAGWSDIGSFDALAEYNLENKNTENI